MSIMRPFIVPAFISWTLCLNGCSGISPVAPVSELSPSSNALKTASLPVSIVDLPLTVMHRYYNPTTGDHMTKPIYYTPSGYNYQGPIFYVPSYSSTPSFSFNVISSLINNGDHMTSTTANEGGYTWEQYLGKVPNTNISGLYLWAYNRYHKSWTDSKGNHIDHMDCDLRGAGGGPPTGYTLDGPLGYAWPTTGLRFADSVGCHASDTTRQFLSFKGISIGAAWNWGGCIVSLMRRSMGNIELVNICPSGGIGREIQSCLWYSCADNPTEGGDCYWNGSPVTNFTQISNSGIPSFVSSAIALQWGTSCSNPPVYYTTRDAPILTGTTFSKVVTIEDSTWIRYDETVCFAKTIKTNPTTHVMPVILYLNNRFNQFWLYRWDSSRGGWNTIWNNPDITNSNNDWIDTANVRNTSCAELLFANNTAGNISVGLFYTPTNGAQYQTYSTWNASTYYLSGSGSGPYDNGTVVMSMNQFYVPVTAGQQITYHPFILVGTKTQIVTEATMLAKMNFGY
jgi:hypothetical protein